MSGAPLERDVVVEVLFAARRRRRRGCRLIIIVPWRRAAPRAAVGAAAHCARGARPAAQHLHIVGNDLGGKPVISLLVLPFSGAQFTFDEHLRALAQVFRGDFAQTAEQGNAMPLGALLLRPGGLVFPRLAGGDPDVRDRHPTRHGTGFRVSAEIADQNDLVYAARHCLPLKINWMPALYTQRPAPIPRLHGALMEISVRRTDPAPGGRYWA